MYCMIGTICYCVIYTEVLKFNLDILAFQLRCQDSIIDIIWHPIYVDRFVIITEHSLCFFLRSETVQLVDTNISFNNIVAFKWAKSGE
jgi:hypothetical protein